MYGDVKRSTGDTGVKSNLSESIVAFNSHGKHVPSKSLFFPIDMEGSGGCSHPRGHAIHFHDNIRGCLDVLADIDL